MPQKDEEAMKELTPTPDILAVYNSWIAMRTTVEPVADAKVILVVTTQYLDAHNDYVQVVVLRTDGGYQVTDDGATTQAVDICSCMEDRVIGICNQFGCRYAEWNGDGAIDKSCAEDDLGDCIHMVAQCCTAVSFLVNPGV